MSPEDIRSLGELAKDLSKKLDLLVTATCPCVPPEPFIYAISTSVCEGSGTVMGYSGPTCNTYQWEEFLVDTWVPIVGEVGQSLTVTGLTAGTHTYRLIESNARCSGISNELQIDVVANELAVYTSADDNEFCIGGTTILHSEVLDGATQIYSNEATFQWQYSVDGITYTDIPGANADDYTPPIFEAEGTYYYRLAVTSLNGCQSNSGVLGGDQSIYIYPDPTVIAYSEESAMCEGGAILFHCELTGGQGNNYYQWQVFLNGVWVSLTGAEGADLYWEEGIYPELLTAPSAEYDFRVIVTQDSGCSVISDTITVLVQEDPLVIIESVTPLALSAGGTFEFSSEVLGGAGGNNYQWQWFDQSTSGWVNSDIFGANASTFISTGFAAFDPLLAGTYTFRVQVVQNSGCETFSNEITITVT